MQCFHMLWIMVLEDLLNWKNTPTKKLLEKSCEIILTIRHTSSIDQDRFSVSELDGFRTSLIFNSTVNKRMGILSRFTHFLNNWKMIANYVFWEIYKQCPTFNIVFWYNNVLRGEQFIMSQFPSTAYPFYCEYQNLKYWHPRAAIIFL